MKIVVNEITKVVSFGLVLISHFWARKLEAPTPGTWAHNQCWHFCVVLNWCWTVWAAVFWMGCYIKDLSTVCGLKKQLVMTLFKENRETSRVSFSLWDPFPYNGLLLHSSATGDTLTSTSLLTIYRNHEEWHFSFSHFI